VNPLAFWSFEDCWTYLRKHKAPYHPLHDVGFSSLGDMQSTRKVRYSLTYCLWYCTEVCLASVLLHIEAQREQQRVRCLDGCADVASFELYRHAHCAKCRTRCSQSVALRALPSEWYYYSPTALTTGTMHIECYESYWEQVPHDKWFTYGGERSGRFEGLKNKDGSAKTECGIHTEIKQ
jgi:3'-phosphoadenosine 5'-phosphosulfate sulfotransferase (PAPS reductase)/FAD synthetase